MLKIICLILWIIFLSSCLNENIKNNTQVDIEDNVAEKLAEGKKERGSKLNTGEKIEKNN